MRRSHPISLLRFAVCFWMGTAWPIFTIASESTERCIRGELAIPLAHEAAQPKSPLGQGSLNSETAPFTLQIRSPGYSADSLFREQFWKATERISARLKSDPHFRFRNALSALATLRGQAASAMSTSESDPFGIWRTFDPRLSETSRMTDKYAFGQELAAALMGDDYAPPPMEMRVPGHADPVMLTHYMPKGHLPGRWVHPPGTQIEPILRHAEHLFDRAVDRDTSPSEVIRAAAEMHWWLAHAMPFQRGSAAITDALVKAIYLSHDIPFSPYRVGIQPDIAAFTLRLDDFLSVYPRFFDLTFEKSALGDLSWQRLRAKLRGDEKFSPIANLGKPRNP